MKGKELRVKMEGASFGLFKTPPAKRKRKAKAYNLLLALLAEGVTKRPKALLPFLLFIFSFLLFTFFFFRPWNPASPSDRLVDAVLRIGYR